MKKSRLAYLKEGWRKETTPEKRITSPWGLWLTPLKLYASNLMPDFEAFLREKVWRNALNGKPFEVLDVGCGTGLQWHEFVQEHKKLANLSLTALTKKSVHPDFKHLAVSCTAASLYRKFKPNSFDFIVTHYGMHGQELDGIENTLHLLKRGGEAIISGANANEVMTHVNSQAGKTFQILNSSSTANDFSLHIKKL